MSRSDAVRWRRAQSGRVVFTNGVFDLLHPGHIDLLTAARALGDHLIVGLNQTNPFAGSRVRRAPCAPRPSARTCSRRSRPSTRSSVFEQDTPLELVLALRPDVLVKGGDYTSTPSSARPRFESWGGRVQVVPLTPGHSTTRIIEALRGN